jgi:hypothetical protein
MRTLFNIFTARRVLNDVPFERERLPAPMLCFVSGENCGRKFHHEQFSTARQVNINVGGSRSFRFDAIQHARACRQRKAQTFTPLSERPRPPHVGTAEKLIE